jgi:hypothetical protein
MKMNGATDLGACWSVCQHGAAAHIGRLRAGEDAHRDGEHDACSTAHTKFHRVFDLLPRDPLG